MGAKRCVFCLLLVLVFSSLAHGQAAPTLNLISNLPSGQVVGATVIWLAYSTGTQEPMDYRLSVEPDGGPVRVLFDFQPENVFKWTPIEDGLYRVVATAKGRITGTITEAEQSFSVAPLAGSGAVVHRTAHPLVALYSAPECDEGQQMRVFAWQVGSNRFFLTNTKPCRAGHTMNFYVGGMRANALYGMVDEVLDASGQTVNTGTTQFFSTPAIDATPPSVRVTNAPDAGSSLYEAHVLMSIPDAPIAVDLSGALIWYYSSDGKPLLTRPVEGGTFLVLEYGGTRLNEIDLAGQAVGGTSVNRINDQLRAAGGDVKLTAFHHEARRLPGGRTAVLGYLEQRVEVAPGQGPVDVLGDCVLILDSDWQMTWFWSAFDHLDVTRQALLGETCSYGDAGCPPFLLLGFEANDWLHSNAISYGPEDGNLLVSLRHQDWIIKIDYRDGLGTGDVLWRLGPDGDLPLPSGSPEPFPWFSHQHDPNLLGSNHLVVFDNGNTRCAQYPDSCVSRGQVYAFDEQTMEATRVFSVPLGDYSAALGSAQMLLNGNFCFTSGFVMQAGASGLQTSIEEYRRDGSLSYSLGVDAGMYRSFRMLNLYTPPVTELR